MHIHTNAPIWTGTKHCQHGQQMISCIYTESGPSGLLETNGILPPDSWSLHNCSYILTLKELSIFSYKFLVWIKHRFFFCKKCILTHCQHYRCSLFKSKPRYKFMLFSKCSFVTYMSSHFLFKRSWIAKFTDFFHSFRSIATILPYLVVSTVWSADDIGPM